MKNKHRFTKFLLSVFPVIWAIIIAILSLLPESVIEKYWFDFFIPPDKIVHLLIYAIFSFSINIALEVNNIKISLILQWIVTSLFVIFYGILMEMLQKSEAIGRSANLSDVLYDCLGVFAGILLFFIMKNKHLIRKIYETKEN